MSNIFKGIQLIEQQLDELSPETLSSYKKKAGAEASALDKAAWGGAPDAQGKINKANKRFSGIIRATKKELDNDVNGIKEEADELNMGDPVTVTGEVQFNGATGDIVGFSNDKHFVIVDLYNHGKRSFHSSDVSFNDYADSDDEEARMYDSGQFRDVDEGKMKDVDINRQDRDGMSPQQFYGQHGRTKSDWEGQFSSLMNPTIQKKKASTSKSSRELDYCSTCQRGDNRCVCEGTAESITKYTVHCSQCGNKFTRDKNEGYSHCKHHSPKKKQGVAEAGYGSNRGYTHGFASPTAPKLGGSGREDDERNSEFDSRMRAITGMIFYNNVDDPEEAMAIGLKQTSKGKWFLKTGNRLAQKVADQRFGPGKVWYPTNEAMSGEVDEGIIGFMSPPAKQAGSKRKSPSLADMRKEFEKDKLSKTPDCKRGKSPTDGQQFTRQVTYENNTAGSIEPGTTVTVITIKGTKYEGTFEHENENSIVMKTTGRGGNPHTNAIVPATHVVAIKKSHIKSMTPTELAEDLPPPENARKTQIAGTLPTYKKAADMLNKTGVQGKALDFGAGLGMGTGELGPDADSYEPFPGEKFKPHFVDVSKIPDNSYHKIVNLNVLNVVPNTGEHKIRDSIVKNIGRVLAPGGVALITTRGKDVLTIKGTPGEEPTSMISKIGTYQKGFTQKELLQYIQQTLGKGFEVSSIKLGPAGVMIKKLDQQGVAEGYLPDESEMKTVYRVTAPDGNKWEVKEYQGDYLTFVNGDHNNTYHATRGMPYGAKDRAIEVVRRMAKQGVAEGAPELLKAEMPLVREIEQSMAQHGYEKGTDEYKKVFDHMLSFHRKFGNAEGINQSHIDEAGDAKPVNMKRWVRDFERREDNNFHTENVLAMAQLVGTPEDVAIMKKLVKLHRGFGLGEKQFEIRHAIADRLRPLVKQKIADSQAQSLEEEELDEACWKGYHKEGNKKMFGKTYPNCVKNEGVSEGSEIKIPTEDGITMQDIRLMAGEGPLTKKTVLQAIAVIRKQRRPKGVAEGHHSESCPHCGGEMVSEELINEKKDACYYKVKSRYKVWPSAYASGALVKCRKKGASNWGNGGKSNEGVAEGSEQVYNIVAVDKSNAMSKPKKLTYKAGSIEEVFDALAANDWYPLEINGVEVINGKHLKQGVAEGQLDEKWTKKYKDSINCSNPKGFSQKAHCAGKQKNESSILEGIEQVDENLHKWFNEKWVRFGPDGKIRGDCARGDDSEGKPKCLPQSKAHSLGKKGRASAASRKRREDPNPGRHGKAINVNTKKQSKESMLEETYHGDEFYEAYGDLWYDEAQLNEAEYQGHKVQLGKPMRGDVKKFKVYVKDPSTGNIKKVNFGDPNMRIKKSNPGRRKSFRARHHCENPGPKTSARYWSCRKW